MIIFFFNFKSFVGLEKGHLVFDRKRNRQNCLRLLLALLGEEHRLDVGEHAALRDGHARQELVQLLVVADGELQMTRDDTRLLVVARGVAGQLEHFGGQIFHHGSQVHGSTGTNALGIVALAEQTVDTAHGELKSGAGRPGLALSLHLATLTTARHFHVKTDATSDTENTNER